MDSKQLEQLIDSIYALHAEDIDCTSCDEQLNCLAEMVAEGYDLNMILPTVQHHLDCCASCREAFHALLFVVRAQQAGQC